MSFAPIQRAYLWRANKDTGTSEGHPSPHRPTTRLPLAKLSQRALGDNDGIFSGNGMSHGTCRGNPRRVPSYTVRKQVVRRVPESSAHRNSSVIDRCGCEYTLADRRMLVGTQYQNKHFMSIRTPSARRGRGRTQLAVVFRQKTTTR